MRFKEIPKHCLDTFTFKYLRSILNHSVHGSRVLNTRGMHSMRCDWWQDSCPRLSPRSALTLTTIVSDCRVFEPLTTTCKVSRYASSHHELRAGARGAFCAEVDSAKVGRLCVRSAHLHLRIKGESSVSSRPSSPQFEVFSINSQRCNGLAH